MKQQIKETASVGSIGGQSIAAAPGRLGSPKKRSFKNFFINYNISNKFRMIPINLYKLGTNKKVKIVTSIKESFNLDSVLAQLSSYENKNTTKDSDVVSYGVEDDKGNLMKVTILNTQAEDFEAYISAYLSQLKDFENSGVDLEDISLAELLYKLKDLFDIRDVQFPNIPEDTVYNADEASDSVEDNMQTDAMDDMGDMGGAEDFDENDAQFSDDGENMEDDVNFEDDEFAEDGDMEEEFTDDESVEDFEDLGNDDTSIKSILNSVMDMLKAQAKEQTARYEAEAEEARARQAEYSARAAEATLSHKEDFVAMQAEKNNQKEQEKKAKQEVDMATYRYKKSKGMIDDPNPSFEGFSDDSLLMQALLTEEDIVLDPMLIRRQEMIERKALEQQRMQATTDDEKREISTLLSLLPRKFALKRQEAKSRIALKQKSNVDDQNTQDTQDAQLSKNKQGRNQQQTQQQGRNQQQTGQPTISETINAAEYDMLDESVKRQFKRYGNNFVRKFRCYGGPKDGAMVTSAADCGSKKDPQKVRQGKISARQNVGKRVRSAQRTKAKAPTKRLETMNKILRNDNLVGT